jgi:shikimate kinase / 3-dehydroquinate synthase
MGAGKTTVAAAVAGRLGVVAVDLDQRVEARAGSTVERIFAERGEAAFRALEREEVRALLATSERCVVALGGGTVTDRETRRLLLSAGTLVTLTAPVAELTRRVGDGSGRPLLADGDVERRLADIVASRAEAYAECHAVIDTSGRDVDALAAEVLAVAEDAPVVVPLGQRTYRVEIGAGVRARLGDRAATSSPGGVVAVVTDANVVRWADEACERLRAAGKRPLRVILEPGEEHKTVGSVERIWDAALDAELDREGLVLAVGGGVVGDLAGFAASTLLRGVAFGQVPTTLLAMVDSSVGGKTGFDRVQGKNLLGTFHQPSFVLCDVECLTTLPEGDRRAGLAEVVKSAWLEGEDAVAMLERDAAALAVGEPGATARAIRMSVKLKARIVTEDERELTGTRMLLNLGHTLGHALEAAAGYRGLRHGEAVALGMVAAFRVAEAVGDLDPAHGARMGRLLTSLGLPVDLGDRITPEALAFLGSDKKRRGDRVRFVLPGAPGQTTLRFIPRDELSGLLARPL